MKLTRAIEMFIDALDEEGEDRVLTGTLAAGAYVYSHVPAKGCLVGLGAGLAGEVSYEPYTRMYEMITPICVANMGSVTVEFDQLYQRDRQGTVVAIYERIRANRAKRAVPPNTLAEVVPEPIRDLAPV